MCQRFAGSLWLSFKASKTISGIETSKTSDMKYYNPGFKASKTLSGIETDAINLIKDVMDASKPLKPFQGLKRPGRQAS